MTHYTHYMQLGIVFFIPKPKAANQNIIAIYNNYIAYI